MKIIMIIRTVKDNINHHINSCIYDECDFFLSGNELSRQEVLTLQTQLWESLGGGMKELSK